MSVFQAPLQNGAMRGPASEVLGAEETGTSSCLAQPWAVMCTLVLETLQKEGTVWQPPWGSWEPIHTRLIFLNRPTATATGASTPAGLTGAPSPVP